MLESALRVALLASALGAAVLASAATLFTIAPVLQNGQGGDCAYNTTCASEYYGISSIYATQRFTLSSDSVVNGFGFNAIVLGFPSGTFANYRVLGVGSMGTPGALITSGSAALSFAAGAVGERFATTEYRFSVADLSLRAGNYYLAFQNVTNEFHDHLSVGRASDGAFTNFYGGVLYEPGYIGSNSVAISVFGTEAPAVAPVPEPATWAMMILGIGAIGFAMRRRKTRTTVAFA